MRDSRESDVTLARRRMDRREFTADGRSDTVLDTVDLSRLIEKRLQFGRA